ncbi:aliphatic sulfonate ABC transporter substrate-binding protein [Paenibacillus sp. HW567]|uniref:aliphatic sulfonate ABC transporter substrate-binding protein n=1 Tax=Paenibacillus sp. HW567 TaxID=1034769 RepID=UPI00035C4A09|nr:aliphatic sulfonate ABC transporter substrate-binding protein [Paenibacillus sp. HW567]
MKAWSKKGFTGLALAMILIMLSACGNSSSNAGQAKNNAATEATATTAQASAEPSASQDNGSDAEKYKDVVVNIDASQMGPLLIAKEKGYFEEEFGKFGAKVEYQTLQSSSQFLEAIASDRLDFVRIGYIGTITGQAAKVGFTSISEGSDGGGDGIIVPKGSSIQSIADLKGKKIGVTKGSSSWGLLLRALQSAGLSASDVQQINLQPDEAQPAFQSGQIDAWVIWEPFRSSQINTQGAKLIAEGKGIGAFNPAYNIVRTKFAKQYPELVVAYLKAYERALEWQNSNLDEAITLLAGLKNLDEETVRVSLKNNVATNNPISDEATKNQQEVADILFNLGELKEKVDVSQVVDNSYIKQALADK